MRDPLYGMIEIPEIAALFIDTVEFERLRNIKQLGICYYIYHSATHTRFEHSLGVCHLASKVCDKLKDHISPRNKQLVCLAALWHDVGHMSFSHLMDSFLNERSDSKLVEHEYRSIEALKVANKSLGYPLSNTEVTVVSKMILGDSSDESNPFLFQIVSNKRCGLDIDRLDYLQRDTYHAGHAGFQPDYIIDCLEIRDNELAVKEKAREELLNMFQTRRRLFKVIYHHKTTSRLEEMFKKAMDIALPPADEILSNWYKWDDVEILYILRLKCPELFEKLARRNLDTIDNLVTRRDMDVEEYMECVLFVEKKT